MFQRTAQNMLLVPVKRLLRVIDVECKVGECIDNFALYAGNLDMHVVVSETCSFVNVQFQFFAMRHQVDSAVNDVFHATGKLYIALAGLAAVVFAPAQPVLVQGRNAVYRGLGNAFQQSWAGEIGTKSEVVKFQNHRA